MNLSLNRSEPRQAIGSDGNSVANNAQDWGIDYVIDTLGRKIDFYYESNLLRKVRQERGASYYDYLTIAYTPVTVATNFSGLSTDPSNLTGVQVWQPWYLEYPTGISHVSSTPATCRCMRSRSGRRPSAGRALNGPWR